MSWSSWALWSFVATIAMTTLMEVAEGLGLTRISLPYLLGTLVTPHRDRAKVIGFFVHVAFGMVLSLMYVAIFRAAGGPSIWKGAIVGLAHALWVLTVGMQILPGIHPRIASETQGPTVERQLEPPGFLALHYGSRTPIFVVIAHIAFGCILGGYLH